MTGLTMYDAIDVGLIPADAQAVAGYTGGQWPTAPVLARRFPRARLLTIAISADEDADALDIEWRDATPEQAAGWDARQRARGIARPCLYASAGVMESAVVPVIRGMAVVRSQVRLWSAHSTHEAHICGPGSCGELSIDADGTQWTDRAMGLELDQSLLRPDFFGAAPAPEGWTEAMMAELPLVRPHDSGEAVRTVQGLCAARRHPVVIDGAFGPATAAAVREVQRDAGIAQDGIVGPLTWGALVSAGT